MNLELLKQWRHSLVVTALLAGALSVTACQPKQETERKVSAPSSTASVPASASSQSVITHRHEVVIGGRQFNVGTDAAGSSEMQQLMAALERDANLSGGVH